MNLHDVVMGGGGLIVVLLMLVELSPIKINPWSCLAKHLGQAINQDLTAQINALSREVDGVRTELQKLQRESEEHSAISCRVRILRFGDEVLHGIRHSKDHFDQILTDITSYNRYCQNHPEFKNNMTELTSHRIEEIYMERLEKNDFL